MRENRPSGSEGGARSIPCPYLYPVLHGILRVELSCIQATSGLLGVGLNW